MTICYLLYCSAAMQLCYNARTEQPTVYKPETESYLALKYFVVTSNKATSYPRPQNPGPTTLLLLLQAVVFWYPVVILFTCIFISSVFRTRCLLLIATVNYFHR